MSKTVKNNIERNLWVTIGIFLAILVVSIVLLVIVVRNEEATKGADRSIRLSGQSGFECEYAEAQKLYVFGDGVIKVTSDRVAYLTLSGNEVFSTSVSYNNPQCFINGSRCVVFDNGGYGFVVMDESGILYSKPTENTVQSAILSDSGLCAIITDSTDAYGEVILYYRDGTQISRWSSYNSGYPICGAFSDNDSFFALTTLNTSGAVYEPVVRLFALNYNNDSISTSDYALFKLNDTSILSYIDYIGNNLYTFSMDTIYTLRNDSLSQFGETFGSINYVRMVNDNIFVVYSDGVNQLNKLRVISSSGSSVYDSEVGSVVNAIASNDHNFALSIDNRIIVFNDSGDVISDVEVDEDIIRIGFTDNNRLVVVSTSGVHTIED
ncbi:MAG: DUF5711 family protein [Saccharofermentans sp.]|nr:DUF5711 family protein [Saccharofermentans sp.]